MGDRTIDEQLTKYLTDVHSIEEQALSQLRTAPKIAADPELSDVFEQHLHETESQEERVRARLDAHDAAPSKAKDVAGKVGGVGMLLFARSQPDTPGKLTAHAFAYEHMEVAAYELLERVAERADDAETVAVAREIGDEERQMAARLQGLFDRAAEASLRELGPDEVGDHLNDYLADAHAIEMQSIELLERAQKMADSDKMRRLYGEHLDETREHEERIRGRLEERDATPSLLKDAALRLGALNWGTFFKAQPDTPAKLAGFAFAVEHLEIGGYELLRRVAERAGDRNAVSDVDAILEQEHQAASRIAVEWDSALDASLEAQGVAG